MNEKDVIRDLLVALEFLRCACEHSDGRTKNDEKQLATAMCVGIRVGAAHAHLIADYQKPSFWRDVYALPEKVL